MEKTVASIQLRILFVDRKKCPSNQGKEVGGEKMPLSLGVVVCKSGTSSVPCRTWEQGLRVNLATCTVGFGCASFTCYAARVGQTSMLRIRLTHEIALTVRS